MDFNLKYTTKDVELMVNTFCSIIEKEESGEKITEELRTLLDYPVPVIEEFIKSVGAISDTLDIKENYHGVIGYILIRLNLVC